jgi:hypothetical protein
MIASPVPTSARKRIGLKGHIDTGPPAKQARQETPPHVSTCALADLENGGDDVDSRARSTEDSIEVSLHVDGILEHDFNYPHDLGQVFGSDLSSIAGVPSSEGVSPIAVVAAFDDGRGVCKNYSERLNSDVYGDEASNREPFDEQEGASNGEPFVASTQRKEVPKVWLDRATIQFRCLRPNSGYTGSFCVFGPVLSSPAHGLPSLAME